MPPEGSDTVQRKLAAPPWARLRPVNAKEQNKTGSIAFFNLFIFMPLQIVTSPTAMTSPAPRNRGGREGKRVNGFPRSQREQPGLP